MLPLLWSFDGKVGHTCFQMTRTRAPGKTTRPWGAGSYGGREEHQAVSFIPCIFPGSTKGLLGECCLSSKEDHHAYSNRSGTAGCTAGGPPVSLAGVYGMERGALPEKLLRQILPMALYRTWEICVEHQARGQDCYVGVAQLASLAGRTVRTLQKNLAELGAKRLLVERAERKVVRRRDGTHAPRVVVVKDFSPLYALAHEYHAWLSSPDYIAPERALCAVLAQDSALVAQVRRYNNYRRVLYTDRPGPLP
ncbi:MAG TPA: hypothetical protein VFV38_33370, partial [Ktedonobacteraceae bacterium]|nr:hypothetical protein [Ktedonobacteraceae bacterium]